MESSVGAIRPPAVSVPAQRPGWLWTILMSIVCALISAIGGRALLSGASVLRLVPDGVVSSGPGWTWPITDAWSLGANAGVALLYGYSFAWVLRRAVRSRSWTWDLRLWPVAFAMALATALEPTLAGLTGFTLVVVVAQAVVLRPASEAGRRSTTELVATVAAAALMLVLTLSYQPLHPLLAAFPGQDSRMMSLSFGPADPRDPLLGFAFENGGTGTVTVRSVHATGRNVGLLDVASYGLPFARMTLPRGAIAQGGLRLSKATCATPAARRRIPLVTIDGLEVRVETLGLVRTQRFDVDPPADLYCR
jgi:hypothetical protein